MNPVAAALITGALVVGGKWSQGKAPNIQNGIGVAGIAVSLSLIEQANERLASAFAWLIIIGVAVVHLPNIIKGTGLATFK